MKEWTVGRTHGQVENVCLLLSGAGIKCMHNGKP